MSLIEKNEVLALIDEIINRDHLTAMARLFLLRREVYDLPPAKSDMTEQAHYYGKDADIYVVDEHIESEVEE